MDELTLIADIGGTNARFMLINGQGGRIHHALLSTADYRTIEDAISAFLLTDDNLSPKVFALAVACPAHGDDIQMTNNHWQFNKHHLKKTFSLRRLVVINDFAALAWAVPGLNKKHLHQWGGDEKSTGNKAVVGPGTGLGVSGIIVNQLQEEKFTIIEGEGGHVTCAPHNEAENKLIARIRKIHPRPSAERLLSGPGIELIYTTLCQLENTQPQMRTAAEISSSAMRGEDRLAQKTLDMYCSMFGSFVGDLALTLGATGGVYIGGGVIPKISQFFFRSAFRERFEQKGRFIQYMQRIPVYVITDRVPAFAGIIKALGYE